MYTTGTETVFKGCFQIGKTDITFKYAVKESPFVCICECFF